MNHAVDHGGLSGAFRNTLIAKINIPITENHIRQLHQTLLRHSHEPWLVDGGTNIVTASGITSG